MAAGTPSAKPKPPHPRDNPLLGSLPEFAKDILGAVLKGWRECGDLVRFRGPRTMTLAAHPDYVKQVMEDRWEIYPRSKVVRTYLKGIMGDGLFIREGEDWRERRRLLEPVFAADRVSVFAGGVVAATEKTLDGWAEGAELDVVEEMMRTSLDALERVLFGAPGDGRFGPAVRTAVEYAIPRVMSPVNPPQFLPAGRRYVRALRQLDALLEQAIRERRRTPGDDLASMLVAVRDAETGQGLDDRQVRDELMNAVFGVYKSIPHALTWTWYLLAGAPRVRDRLTRELTEVLGGRTPTIGDLPRLEYTAMVVQEVLRLYPPLWIWSRPPVTDDEIDGYRIPAGMFVLMIPYITHRHPEFWENPEEFDPERFSAQRSSGRHPHAYFPFASGPRRCVGESFGLMWLQLVVATIAQRYRLDSSPGYEIERSLEFVLRPSNGLPMTAHAQRG